MVYLDYSATTPVDSRVIDTYSKVCREFIGNPNSLHKLGVESKKLIIASTRQIADILGIKEDEVIYTSGASEANNQAIKGTIFRYKNRGRHIITTELEHSSVTEPIKYLEKFGFRVSYVKLDEYGRVDLDDLRRLVKDDAVLVSIGAVNSEVGIVQDMASISKVVREYPEVILHSDVTQAIGKMKFDFSLIDLASFSAQKFFGMKGVGVLFKRHGLEIDPLIHGGKSTTIYRSGTPSPALIASTSLALRLVYQGFDNKLKRVEELNKYLVDGLSKLDVDINSNKYSIPHIVNFSLRGIKSEVMLHALEEDGIYISTKTACSSGGESIAVKAITRSKSRAETSMRVSISYLTTVEEIDYFLDSLRKNLKLLEFSKR